MKPIREEERNQGTTKHQKTINRMTLVNPYLLIKHKWIKFSNKKTQSG